MSAAPIFLLLLFFIARVTRDFTSQLLSLLMVIAMLVLAICILPAEELSSGWLGRREISPLTYRIGYCLVFVVPAVLWAFYPLRYYLEKRRLKREGMGVE